MLKLASLMLALGIGLMMLNILHYHFPYAVVPLLVGCVTANTVTAGLRLIWPTINLHVLAQTCNVFLTLCIALWMWRVLTTGGIGPSIEHGMAPIVVFVGVYFVFSFAPFFAFGRTAGDSLRSALVFFVALVTVKLPFVFTAEVAWALAILQIGANMALAWMIGSNHARYLLTDHLLTLGQSNRGWTAFGWLYQLPPLMLLPAL
ncbi:MAG TPA: hypothetical protein VE988_20615, partial [Gemmataceae bacterium]|nr:hypothetical protein [Gemmataceae bacterium]